MELLIRLKGQLDRSIPESVRKAMADAAELQKKMQRLQAVQAKAQKYKEMARAAEVLGERFRHARETVSRLGAEFRKNQEAAARYRAQINQAKAALSGMSRSANPEAYRAARASLAQLTAAYQSAQAAARASRSAFTQASANARTLGSAYNRSQDGLRRLSAELQRAGFYTQFFDSNQRHLQNELRRTSQEMERARRTQEQYNNQQAQQAQRQRAHGQAQTDFYNATGNWKAGLEASKTILSPFVGAISSAMDFEAEMAKVKSMTQMDNIKLGNWERVNSEMQKLTEQAKEMGRTTQFTSVQAAQAQFELAKAGYDTEKVYASLPHVLNMAAVENMELGDAARIATNIMSGFGLGADKIEHSIDVLAYTSTHANTDLRSLGETMKYAAPVAKSFGASLEETATMAKFMADAGIAGSQAGTSLRQGMLRLVAPPKKASKAMQEMGISLSDAQAEWANAQATAQAYGITLDSTKGPGEQLISVIEQIEKSMAGASDQEKIAALNAITGINAVSGWAAVMSNSSGSIREFYEKLRTCDGAAKQAAATMQDTTKGAFTRLNSAVEAVAQNIGDAFLPVVRAAAEKAAVFATKLAEWAGEHQSIVLAAGAAAAAIAGMIMTALTVNVVVAGWRLLETTIDMVAASQTLLAAKTRLSAIATMIHAGANAALGASMTALRHPITTVTALFGAIPARLAAARAALMAIPAMISGAFAAIPGMISGALASLATVGLPVIVAILAIVAVIALVAANFDKLKETASIVFNHISGTVGATVARIQQHFQDALNKITAVWNSVTGQSLQSSQIIGAIFNNLGFLIGAAFDIAAGIVGTAISVIINLVASVAQIIGGVINIVAGLFTGDWNRAWQGAGQAVKGFSDATLGTFKTIAGGIGDIFDTLLGKADEVQAKAEQAKSASAGAQMSNRESGSMQIAAQVAAIPMPDTSAAQAQVAALGESATQTATATQQNAAALEQYKAAVEANGQGMEQYTQMIQQGGQSMAQLGENLGTALPNVTQFGETAGQATPNLAQLSETVGAGSPLLQQHNELVGAGNPLSAQHNELMTAGNALLAQFKETVASVIAIVQQFASALTSTNEGLASLGSSSSVAASAISSLGSAAQGAVSTFQSAASSVAAAAANAGSGANVAHNAEGGIYQKGAFLTTFAENSAEAAIPLDGSRRAASLWRQAGEMLGILPKRIPGGDGTATAEQALQNMPTLSTVHMQKPPMMPDVQIPELVQKPPVMPDIRIPDLVQEIPSMGNILPDLAGMGKRAASSILGKGLPKWMPQGAGFLGGMFQRPPLEASIPMVNALPQDIGMLAELAMPGTEGAVEAPMAMEPPSGMGGAIEINYNPQITIQGNADGSTVSQLEELLASEREKILHEVSKKFGGMMEVFMHEQRRRSYAT
jgi:TP901 family phage tail tape measure protein